MPDQFDAEWVLADEVAGALAADPWCLLADAGEANVSFDRHDHVLLLKVGLKFSGNADARDLCLWERGVRGHGKLAANSLIPASRLRKARRWISLSSALSP